MTKNIITNSTSSNLINTTGVGTTYTSTGTTSSGFAGTTTLNAIGSIVSPLGINIPGDAIIYGDIHLKGKLIFEGDDKDKKQNELYILNKLEKLASKLFPNGADTLKLSTDSTKFLNLYMVFKLTNKITSNGMIFLNKLYGKR